jgi:hypothetical protein
MFGRKESELIDGFFAEYPPAPDWSDKFDTEEADKLSRLSRRLWPN